MHGIRLLGCRETAGILLRLSALSVVVALASCAAPARDADREPLVQHIASRSTGESTTTKEAERASIPPDSPEPPVEPAPTPPSPPVTPSDAQPAIIRLPNGIVVDRARRRVEIPAQVAQTSGFLEQIACGEESREHESLLVIARKASEVHAALLLAGAVPGKPGSWRPEGEGFRVEPPTGTPVRVRVRVPASSWGERSPTSDDPPGPPIERDIADWVRGADGKPFNGSWVFAGSRFAPNPKSWKKPGEHYVADFTGSIVGLVTFGDETVAAMTVIPDLVEFEAAEWQAWTERIPFSGTEATLIIECDGAASTAPSSAKPA